MSNKFYSTGRFEFSTPRARRYHYVTYDVMSHPDAISEGQKYQMIQALQTHRYNTIIELRRIEKIFASLGSSDLTQPMTAAWSYHVNSNSLLTELRSLTRNYPFSAYCLEEAKRRVYSDPASNRSWNICWLVLVKIQSDSLIPHYAYHEAAQPAMWGDSKPTPEHIRRLGDAFAREWEYALQQLLRHWDKPPTR